MTLAEIFSDKTVKAKARAATVGAWLLEGTLPVEELIVFAEQQKAVDKASCIEALEYATKKQPGIADENLMDYVSDTLADEEPRIKWESAKVIGNVAKLFPGNLERPIKNLLSNAENKGTVVRWATAYALAEILKLKTGHNKKLLPQIGMLCEKEVNSGVQKKYRDALKKVAQ